MRTEKSQSVRFLDVFFVGPLIIYAGAKGKHEDFIKALLIMTGILTITYNGKNYLLNVKEDQ